MFKRCNTESSVHSTKKLRRNNNESRISFEAGGICKAFAADEGRSRSPSPDVAASIPP